MSSSRTNVRHTHLKRILHMDPVPKLLPLPAAPTLAQRGAVAHTSEQEAASRRFSVDGLHFPDHTEDSDESAESVLCLGVQQGRKAQASVSAMQAAARRLSYGMGSERTWGVAVQLGIPSSAIEEWFRRPLGLWWTDVHLNCNLAVLNANFTTGAFVSEDTLVNRDLWFDLALIQQPGTTEYQAHRDMYRWCLQALRYAAHMEGCSGTI
ncbi:hypothetical protein FN846DRAFT_905357 [Sphaerosporella brunnea]|uniref:Uncharacterized protein n=1 Tax=Sphaerosporella brunnea TaxID=1250544 RepID=A0A5J5F1B4_9PEZI|nr:hypothetical protein FN846DRAFT_905357 [Sphaerosporella brunnea]